LVNKVSKLYVGKSKMSEEIGGLYVGLGGGGDDRVGSPARQPLRSGSLARAFARREGYVRRSVCLVARRADYDANGNYDNVRESDAGRARRAV
jgi:hypothetical protein